MPIRWSRIAQILGSLVAAAVIVAVVVAAVTARLPAITDSLPEVHEQREDEDRRD